MKKLSGAVAQNVVRPSEDLGPQGKLMWVSKTKISIDDRYQRAIGRNGETHINKITRGFRWALFQTLTLAPADRPEHYVAIDGQHRWMAAMKHPAVDLLPCYVLPKMTVVEQAAAFEALNGVRLGITRLQRFWTKLAAQDPDTLRIKRICDAAGVVILKNVPSGNIPPSSIIATSPIEKLFNLDDKTLIDALSVMRKVWGDSRNGFRSAFVYAVCYAAGHAGRDLDLRTLETTLRGLDMNEELLKANNQRASSGGVAERIMAAAVWAKYETISQFYKR